MGSKARNISIEASSVTSLHSRNGCGFIPPLGLKLLYEYFLPILSTCLLHPKWDSAVTEMEIYSFFGSSAVRRSLRETDPSPPAQDPQNSENVGLGRAAAGTNAWKQDEHSMELECCWLHAAMLSALNFEQAHGALSKSSTLLLLKIFLFPFLVMLYVEYWLHLLEDSFLKHFLHNVARTCV